MKIGAPSVARGTYVPSAGAAEKAGILTFRDGFKSRTLAGDTGNGFITMKAVGDTAAGVIDWRHSGDFGYLIHLATGLGYTDGSSVALIGLGVGDGDGVTKNAGGTGLLINNKKSGVGIKLLQNSTIDAAGAYGLYLQQLSTLAPGMLMQQEIDGAAALCTFQVLSSTTPTAGQRITEWYDKTGLAGGVRALDGILDWRKAIRVANNGGVQSYDSAAVVRSLIILDASNVVTIGDQNIASQPITLAAGGNTDITMKTNGSVRFTFNATGLTAASGRIIVAAAATTGVASVRLPHGVAPTSPIDGDMWTTSAGGLFVRINGVTKTVTLT